LKDFDADSLLAAIQNDFEIQETPLRGDHVDEFCRDVLPKQPAHTFGLFDGASRKIYQLSLQNLDVLKRLEPEKSEAWRRLDVAILQRYLIEDVLGPKFGGGKEPVKGYTADPDEIAPQVDGERYQIALMLQATPLHALEELGKHNEVMPQKSTYFYPKVATGVVINSLR
jgi:uncharacterized protein (DUF1015 family)